LPIFTTGEDLYLLENDGGAGAQIAQGIPLTVTAGEIIAAFSVTLWVGDNLVANAVNRIAAGSSIRIHGDERRKPDGSVDTDPDTGFGSTMLLRGTIGRLNAPADVTQSNPNAKTFTQIFGNADVDTYTFDRTRLDANTTVFGSAKSDGETLLAHDGEDRFIVTQLSSMHVD